MLLRSQSELQDIRGVLPDFDIKKKRVVVLTKKQLIRGHLKAPIGEQHCQRFQWAFSYSKYSQSNFTILRLSSFRLASLCY